MDLESDDDDSSTCSSGRSSDFGHDINIAKWYVENHWNECNEDDDIINRAESMTINHFSAAYTVGDYQRVGSLLGRCKELKRIKLEGSGIKNGLIALFQAEGPYNFPLQSLELETLPLGAKEFETLVPFLKTRTVLKRLKLFRNNLDNRGARLLAGALDELRVTSLEISFNEVTAMGLSKILSSRNAIHLEKIVFKCKVLQGTVNRFSHFLLREESSLNFLSLGIYDQLFREEWLEDLISILHQNSTLETLRIYGDSFAPLGNGLLRSKSFHERVSDAINALICDTSSFDSICRSNHVFRSLSLSSSLSFDLHQSAEEVMEINARPISLNQRLRCKLKKYFFQEKFDLQPFLSMKPVFMPKAIELVTRSKKWVEDPDKPRGNGRYIMSLEGSLNGIYCFIRQWNMPVLFTFPSTQSKIQKLELELERVKLELSDVSQKYEKFKSDSARKIRDLESDRLQRDNEMLQVTHHDNQTRKHPRRDAK